MIRKTGAPAAIDVAQAVSDIFAAMPGSKGIQTIISAVGSGDLKATLGINPSDRFDQDFPLRYHLDMEKDVWIREFLGPEYEALDVDVRTYVFPASLTPTLVVNIMNNLFKFHDSRIRSLLGSTHDDISTPARDELGERFRLASVSLSNIIRMSKGEFDPLWKVADVDLPYMALDFWNWGKRGIASLLSEELAQLYSVLGKQLKQLGLSSDTKPDGIPEFLWD